MTTSQQKVLIIDGHSWMHRAFHAISTPLTAPDGRPTNAIFGFFSMLNKTLVLLSPEKVVVAFDDGKPDFRIKMLERYKIQRPPTDPDLKAQFPIAKELLQAMRVPVASIPGIEGDDILGTLSLRGEQAGLQVFLATGDRDAYQLVSEQTRIISQGRGSDGPRVIGSAQVEERYGIKPSQVIDYLGLKGDSSDNIPGVPGVGEKTATKLLCEYGSLDAILEAASAGKIAGRVGQNLVEHRELALVSRKVATILRDVDLDLDLEMLHFGDYSADDIRDSFMRYGLKSAYGWMTKFSSNGVVGDSIVGAHSYAPAGSHQVARQVGAMSSSPAATSEQNNPVGAMSSSPAATSEQNNTVGVMSASEEDMRGSTPRILVPLRGAIASEDLPEALRGARSYHLSYPLCEEKDLPPAPEDFNITVAAYLLASHKNDYSLPTLLCEYLGIDPVETEQEDLFTTTEVDPELLARLAAVLQQRLKDDGSYDLYQNVELPLLPILKGMEDRGITVDPARLAELAVYGRTHIEELRAEIYELAGSSDFNLDSPKQLAEILFDRLGLPVIKKTRTGRSTDASVLAELSSQHPIAAKITEYRELTKLQNTYLEALPRLIASDGRIHTSFNQTVTATGRLSSSNPNLQNIPVRTELGRRIREAFVPGDCGWQIVAADYSQIELRVLAELSGDEGLIAAFMSGEDFHAQTAARIFGLPFDEAAHIDPALRSRAKAVNFGIIYGQGPHGLGQALDIPFGEAKEIIERYYATFPRVKAYLNEVVAYAHAHGYVATYFGRKRHIPELRSSNRALRAFGERTAMNHPMQGTAADLIKLAMIAVDARLRDEGLQARMLLQVHDELVFEAPQAECVQLRELVTRAMTTVAPDFIVPLEVNVSVGATWAEAK